MGVPYLVPAYLPGLVVNRPTSQSACLPACLLTRCAFIVRWLARSFADGNSRSGKAELAEKKLVLFIILSGGDRVAVVIVAIVYMRKCRV